MYFYVAEYMTLETEDYLKTQHKNSFLSIYYSDRVGFLKHGFWKCHGEMGFWQVEQGFSTFFTQILAYLMIYQIGACQKHCQTLKNYQTHMPKICQKIKE